MLGCIDLTSAHYLGLEHASHELPSWSALTSGRPAVLRSPKGAEQVARQVAELQRLDAGLVGASTLHLFHDLFRWFCRRPVRFFVDEHAYPISTWALRAAVRAPSHVHRFKHLDSKSAERAVSAHLRSNERMVVVTDGYCPSCGRMASLTSLVELAELHTGYLVFDASQTLGLFGKRPTRERPYGMGGGGILPLFGLRGSRIISVTSLAKSFASPLAVVSGPRDLVTELATIGTQVHSSPASVPVVLAAERALRINRLKGDLLRRTLACRVAQFRAQLVRLPLRRGFFPVQILRVAGSAAGSSQRAHFLQSELMLRGVFSLVLNGHDERAGLAFVINSRHSEGDIERVCSVLMESIRVCTRSLSRNTSVQSCFRGTTFLEAAG